eukprot:jgi/Chrzof1/2775/Cz11g28230.t1
MSMCNSFRRGSGRFKFHEAVQEGDTAKLAEFARTSSHGVDDYDDEGQTALHLAADQGLAEAVSLLTHSGANINVPREEDNRTPLHIAVNEGHGDVVAALLEAGAEVNTVDLRWMVTSACRMLLWTSRNCGHDTPPWRTGICAHL